MLKPVNWLFLLRRGISPTVFFVGVVVGLSIALAFVFGFAWGKDGVLSSTAAAWSQALVASITIGSALYLGHLQISKQREYAVEERKAKLLGYAYLIERVAKVVANSSRVLTMMSDETEAAVQAKRLLSTVVPAHAALKQVPVHEVPYVYASETGLSMAMAAGMFIEGLEEISNLPNGTGVEWHEVARLLEELQRIADATEIYARRANTVANSYNGLNAVARPNFETLKPEF